MPRKNVLGDSSKPKIVASPLHDKWKEIHDTITDDALKQEWKKFEPKQNQQHVISLRSLRRRVIE